MTFNWRQLPIRVMVVDDDPQIGEFLCEFLVSKGYEPYYTDNGEDALRMARRIRPHIALLDIRMGGMDGLELLERIRRLDPVIAPIMITAVYEEEVGRKALQMGAVDYLLKPVDFDYLQTSLTVKLAAMLE